MERSPIIPHLSWSGPQPDREVDAYLLAMLVRVYSSGLENEDESDRDIMLCPSVLTTANLHMVAVMYAYYKERMEENGARNTEAMLKLVRDSDEDDVPNWLLGAEAAVSRAEKELLEFVETVAHPGFTAFG